MNFSLIASTPLPIEIHLATVLPAFAIGTGRFSSRPKVHDCIADADFSTSR
jgi:hypothetical protein